MYTHTNIYMYTQLKLGLRKRRPQHTSVAALCCGVLQCAALYVVVCCRRSKTENLQTSKDADKVVHTI